MVITHFVFLRTSREHTFCKLHSRWLLWVYPKKKMKKMVSVQDVS